MPAKLKALLKPLYHQFKVLTFRLAPVTYENQMQAELARFEGVEEVNDLPAIFHYWSNRYLRPKFTAHGFKNPNEFFLQTAHKVINDNDGPVDILSVGSGNCDTEIKLAVDLVALGHHNFQIQCMDINQSMFNRGMKMADQLGVSDKLSFVSEDFNQWQARQQYQLIIANQSLHHVVALEHLFDQIKQALTDNGKFITSDVIGRNGHMRWPEALKVINKIWRQMPERYRFNHAFKRHEKKFINHDCSKEGFEGIRAQDVLPLLAERFDFELFIPYANLIMVFVDRSFGPNFDINNPADLAFIDEVNALDESLLQAGTVKPTQMLAVMNNHQATTNPQVLHAIRRHG